MKNNIEYSLDLCLTVRKLSTLPLFFLVPGVPRCPEGAVWQNNVGTGTSPAAQLRWRRAPLQAASLPPWAAIRQLLRECGFVSCEMGRKSYQRKRILSCAAKRGKRNQMGLPLG